MKDKPMIIHKKVKTLEAKHWVELNKEVEEFMEDNIVTSIQYMDGEISCFAHIFYDEVN